MPTFDVVLLLQKMDKSALKSALKRNAEYIFQAGGTIRQMENLGFRELPFKIFAEGKQHKECHHFVIKYDGSLQMKKKLGEQFELDRDVVRARSFQVAVDPLKLHSPKVKKDCTIYEDELPPPYRPVIVNIHDRLKKKQEEKEKKNKFPLKNIDNKEYLIF